MFISNSHFEKLDKDGYCILEPDKKYFQYIGASLDYLRQKIDSLIESEGEKAGYEGREEYYKQGKKFEPIAKRLGNLANKDEAFFNFSILPDVLWASYHVIKNEIMISSSNFREPNKGQGQQRLHIDWLPRENFNDPYGCVVSMLYLDNSCKENGAIRIVPGTHKKLGFPDNYVNPYEEHPESVAVEADAGSIIILNTNLWHRGGENLTGARRRIINTIYRNRNLDQGLNQRQYLDKKIQEKMSYEEKFFFKILDSDIIQKEKVVGPGNVYRDWLVKNPHRNFSKSKDIFIKHI
jgi:hypothetical protein